MWQTPNAPPLDPAFVPAIQFIRRYQEGILAPEASAMLVIALERERGFVSHYTTVTRSDIDEETHRYVERIVKFLLWARGGWRLTIGGPRVIGERIQQAYRPGGARAFDADVMSRIYGHPFEVCLTDVQGVPPDSESSSQIGGHFDGCRIGFDLGASDYKVAAVKDGEPVFSAEFPWNPRDEADPEYHYHHLSNGVRAAAAHLSRVDAIGGSSAGVIVDNQIMVASLIRSVPEAKLPGVRRLFHRLAEEWNAPVAVANDGDVTALAGAISLKKTAFLGIALGSSQAAGYINRQGAMTGWLNEFAFAPADYNPVAPRDEWSQDAGVGALYFSQQAVNRLLPAAGIVLPHDMPVPERLKEVQALMAQGDVRAEKIYQTIGAYLGWTIPLYAAFYDFSDALLLGRVTTGCGGEILLDTARGVLAGAFQELAGRIELHLPDEKSRRVGQAVAAASLPALLPK